MEQKALKILYLKSASFDTKFDPKTSLFSSLAKEAKIINMFTINSVSSSAAASTSKTSSSSSSSSSFSSKRVRLISNFERRRGEGFKVRAEPAKPKLKKAVRFTVVVVVVVSNYYRLLTCLFMYAGGIHGWWRRRERLLRRRRD